MKKAFKPCVALCSAALLSLALSSCGTIFSSSSPKITIDGNVQEPVTIVTNKETLHNVRLPQVVRVSRRAIDGQRVKVFSQTKQYRDVVLDKSFNAVSLLNLFSPYCIGWVVDLATNSVSRPSQKNYYIQAQEGVTIKQEESK